MKQIQEANLKRTKSKLRYFLTRGNREHFTALTQPIAQQEIIKGTKQQQNHRAVGTDNAPWDIHNLPQLVRSSRTPHVPLPRQQWIPEKLEKWDNCTNILEMK